MQQLLSKVKLICRKPIKTFRIFNEGIKTERVKCSILTSHDELAILTIMNLRKEGKTDSDAIVKKLCDASPTEKKCHRPDPEPESFTPIQALGHVSRRSFI